MSDPRNGLIIASQMPEAMNARLRSHPGVSAVLAAEPERPWETALEADMFLIGPNAVWRAGPPRPAGWPGRLRLIQSASVGVDWYPRWLLDGPPMTCGRGTAAEPIAEFVLAAILDHAKRLGDIRVRAPEDWKRVVPMPVAGGAVGLVGFGAIGARVAALALAFGATVRAARRTEAPLPPGVARAASLEELAASSDHLVLAVPSTAATRGLIGDAVFSAAKPGLHLVNVARGALIDEAALLRALDSGQVAAASLDVTDPEPPPAGHWMYAHLGVRLTPHVSWAHPRGLERIGEKLVANLDRFLAGSPLEDLVDPASGY